MRDPGAALIVIDVQRGFDDPVWGERDNPACEANIAALIEHWRAHGRPLVFVRHDSDEPGSTLAPDHPGHAFKDLITGEPDLLVAKSVNSTFHGEPDLQAWFDGQGIDTIYVCGITTNHCCETTARVGGNLGYDVRFVRRRPRPAALEAAHPRRGVHGRDRAGRRRSAARAGAGDAARARARRLISAGARRE